MHLSHGFGPSVLCGRGGSKQSRSSFATRPGTILSPKSTIIKAKARKEQDTQISLPASPKINAFLVAALPLITALPAGASEIQHYIQLAAPGLAVVIGSLAYAAAAPASVKRNLFTAMKQPAVDHVSLDEILQTEYHPSPGAVPVLPKLKDLVEELRDQAATSESITVLAATETGANITELDGRESDAEVPAIAAELAGSSAPVLSQSKEQAQGRGRMMLMAFAGQQGRTGNLSQSGASSNSLESSLLKEKGTEPNTESEQGKSPEEKAEEIVSYVMEWTGLDAREAKKEGSVQGNVVPLHKTGDQAAKGPVSLASVLSGVNDNGAPDGELATVAMVATVPSAAVATLAEEPIKSSTQLRAEHKEKIDSLMSQVASIKAVAVPAGASSKVEDPTSSQQKEYDAKVNAMKHSAAHKQKQEEIRWQQQRASLESKMNQATKERLQAVQPYSALATTHKPQGLAKLHPKALIASIVDTMIAVWRLVLNTAKRFVGQDPPAPQMQT